jgi:hypothetical protein
MAFTKGELLRHAIAFALRRVRLSGRRLGLTEDDRMRVADDTLRELRRYENGESWTRPLMVGRRLQTRPGPANPITEMLLFSAQPGLVGLSKGYPRID